MSVSAVLLAAGASSRFGSPKLLAEIEGEPILRRVARTFESAGFDEVLVVLPSGEDGGLEDLLRKVLKDVPGPVQCVGNPGWKAGMFTSVKVGLAAVAATGLSTHVAVSPADLPFLRKESLRTILAAAASLGERTLAVPTHAGRRGHPLLFSTALIPRVLSWPDDRRLSDLLGEADLRVRHLDGFADGIHRDVDRPEDLR